MTRTGLLLLALILMVGAQAAELVHGGPLVDEEFGIRSAQTGLRREVEVAQWAPVDGGRALDWHAAASPVAAAVEPREWLASVVMADGKPVDPQALRAIGTWRRIKVEGSQLAPNLQATFLVEGGRLTTAADPGRPEPGDLRIGWSELVLPSLEGRVVEQGGVWRLADAVDTGAMPEPPSADGSGNRRSQAPWVGGLLLLVVAGLLLRHRRRFRRAQP